MAAICKYRAVREMTTVKRRENTFESTFEMMFKRTEVKEKEHDYGLFSIQN